MGALSKSPLNVARQAVAIAQQSLPLYAHRYSPKVYTQHQLFACLVLKTFFKMDYRGICVLLQDFDALRAFLGLRRVPHFTTLHKAASRLLRQPKARRVFHATVRRFFGRKRRLPRVAFDSTGLDLGRRSPYFTRRRRQSKEGQKRVDYTHFAKFEGAFDCDHHVLVGVLVSRGPRPDNDRFVPLLDVTLDVIKPLSILADAGYDSESNHRYARERHRIRSFMPATHGRPTKKLPTGRHRRHMKQRLTKHYGSYGQRWQAETGFSMLKRRIAEAVAARTYWTQAREVWLMAITYNVMLLHAAAGFLQSMSGPFSLDFAAPSLILLASEDFDPTDWAAALGANHRLLEPLTAAPISSSVPTTHSLSPPLEHYESVMLQLPGFRPIFSRLFTP